MTTRVVPVLCAAAISLVGAPSALAGSAPRVSGTQQTTACAPKQVADAYVIYSLATDITTYPCSQARALADAAPAGKLSGERTKFTIKGFAGFLCNNFPADDDDQPGVSLWSCKKLYGAKGVRVVQWAQQVTGERKTDGLPTKDGPAKVSFG